ncbi:MAG: aminodeoxychorismate synthase component I [Motiliproteus sp.]
MHLNKIQLDYQPDSAPLFESIRSLPYPVFLDSSSFGGAFGRFDILCADPNQLLTRENGTTHLTQRDGSSAALNSHPFAALRQILLEQGFNGLATPGLPFCGGALGYFSYDLGRDESPRANPTTDDVNLPQMQVGIYPWAIIVDHQQHRTTLVSQSLSRQQLELIIDSFCAPANGAFKLNARFQSNLTRDAYLQRFQRVIDYIHAGDCYQINLAQRFSCAYQGDPWSAYLRLRRQTHTPFSAYIESPRGCLLSLSPERFLQVREGQVETRPIKGTRPRHPLAEQDQQLKQALIESAKDRAENLMIVDLLRNDLGRQCITGSVKVPELFKIESYANVHHMVSAITGQLAHPIEAIDLLQNCFPGGSITGAPKIRAMQIIAELEPNRRTAYCGSIGYIGFNGEMDSNICIRTLVATRNNNGSASINQGQLHCWAGGGIVADSIGDSEYQETFDKVNNLIRCLEDDFL